MFHVLIILLFIHFTSTGKLYKHNILVNCHVHINNLIINKQTPQYHIIIRYNLCYLNTINNQTQKNDCDEILRHICLWTEFETDFNRH